MKGIRLTDSQVLEISKAFRANFLLSDHLWIFGSRVNLNERGGDIDLYIETSKNSKEIIQSKLHFLTELETVLGEQKIDVVIKCCDDDFNLPIYDVAKKEGIQLL